MIELVPLVCFKCQAAIPARVDEVAWVCPSCGQALLLSEEKGTQALAMQFAASITPGKSGLPFWVATGKVTLLRQIYGGGDQSREAQAFWQAPRRFFVPAFDIPLDPLVETGTRLLLSPPALTPGPAAAFAPVTILPGDAQPLAEYIVMGIEAERKDKLKEIQFSLALDAPELWVLP